MNILIAEDEAPAARRLERLVTESLGPRLRKIEIASTIETARQALAGTRFDILLLDLDLNGADGFSLVSSSPGAPRIIVVSARSDRAIDAFNHAVVDFVTKPVSAARLGIALTRAMDQPAVRAGVMTLAVRSAGRIDLAAFDDIVSLSGADDYVEVLLADGRRFLHDTSLQDLERRLPPGFIRVHRSHIANTAHIRGVKTLPGRRRVLELTGGAQAPVSRSRLAAVSALIATDR